VKESLIKNMRLFSFIKKRIERSSLKEFLLKIIQINVVYAFYSKLYFNKAKNVVPPTLKPKAIFVETFNVCNARCTMCPYLKMTRQKVRMDIDLFCKIIDDAEREGIKRVGLHFYNEPLMDSHLFKKIAYVKKKGLDVLFFSNGSLMDKEIAGKILSSQVDEIYFSVDGASKKTYEKIRVGLNYEKTRENIRYLKKERDRKNLKKPKMYINFVIQKSNLSEQVSLLESWNSFVDKINWGYIDNRNDHKKWRQKKLKPFPCRRLWDGLQVMSDGRVALCCVDYNGQVIIGDLKKQTISDIWQGQIFTKIKELHLNGQGDKIGLCKNCSQLYEESAFSWWFERDITL